MKNAFSLVSPSLVFAGAVSFVIFSFSCSVLAAGELVPSFVLNSPDSAETVIGKRPSFSLKSNVGHDESMLVILDDMDLSGLVQWNGATFSFQPVVVLPAGDHTLYIAGVDTAGNPVEQEFFFTTRHSEAFTEAYSNNELSIIYRGVVKHRVKRDEAPPEPVVDDFWIVDDTTALLDDRPADDFAENSFDAYLATESLVREGKWASSFAGNIRYFDNSADIFEPEKRGLSVIDFLLSGSYSGEDVSVELGLGDTGIQESPNTIDSLYRRGVTASLRYGGLTVTGYGVLAEEQYNDIDELGVAFNSNDHIMGISAQIDFFERQMSLKAIYANGGEEGDGIGVWSDGGPRKGNVAGLVFNTDFFSGELLTEIEYDEANITSSTQIVDEWESVDATTDDDGKKRDQAYRVRIGGLKTVFNYELSYEYTGPDYEVVGNQGLVSDRAGYAFVGGYSSENHGVNIFANKYWDNVETDPFYQRLNSLGAGIEYSYLGWLQFPLTISYERGGQRSDDEPFEVEETSIDIDTAMVSLGYQNGPWMGDVSASFSKEDDHGEQDFDNELITLFLSPGYSGEQFTILPSWSYNTINDIQSAVRTNTHTWTLDMQSFFFGEQLLCELGGTYDWSTSDDDTMDNRNFQGYVRGTYRVRELWNLVSPTIALEFVRDYQEDAIAETSFREDVVTIILSSTLPYSF